MNTHFFRVEGHNRLGVQGEMYARKLLESDGFKVDALNGGCDLRAVDPETGVIVYVEVKTALAGRGGFFSFCFNKHGHTSTRHADVVLMFCIQRSGAYMMYCAPASVFEGKSSTRISWGSPKYLNYRCDCLDLIRGMAGRTKTR